MAHLDFADFYQVPDLKFDIQKMRSDLELILKKKGFKGKFIIPLPSPRITKK